MRPKVCILLNEREPSKAEAAQILEGILRARNLEVARLPVVPELVSVIEAGRPQVLVLDYLLGDYTTGLDVLEALKDTLPARFLPQCVFLTDEPSLQVAVDAMRLGARHYIEFSGRGSLNSVADECELALRNTVPPQRPHINSFRTLAQLPSLSPLSIKLRAAAKGLALLRPPITVIVGPTGSGRATLARALAHEREGAGSIREYDCNRGFGIDQPVAHGSSKGQLPNRPGLNLGKPALSLGKPALSLGKPALSLGKPGPSPGNANEPQSAPSNLFRSTHSHVLGWDAILKGNFPRSGGGLSNQHLSLVVRNIESDGDRLLTALLDRRDEVWPSYVKSTSFVCATTNSEEVAHRWVAVLDAKLLTIPSLTDRFQDLPLFLNDFLSDAQRLAPRGLPQLPATLTAELSKREWPGDLAQLKSVLLDALLSGVERHESLITLIDEAKADWEYARTVRTVTTLDPVAVMDALVTYGNDLHGAAQALGVSFEALESFCK